MASVLIVSGSGAYADPWHPFADTSARLAALFESRGQRVRVDSEVESALLNVGSEQLVVINIGNPTSPPAEATMIEIEHALAVHLAGGGGLLAVHVSATSFTTMPRWPEIMGGHWVRGTSMHPPLDLARIHLHAGAHPVAGDGDDFEVLDERYSYLEVRDDVTVIGDHVHDDVVHPMIWAREHGAGRVVYDGLGHDTRSYDSADHRALLERALDWLVGDR